jgi:hypothetical protein
LRNSLLRDLAAKFETQVWFIQINNFTVASLAVDFTVFPSSDGAQIRESSFLAASNGNNGEDTTWLSSTQSVFAAASGGQSFTVLSARYENAAQTQPPTNSVCADGCAGALTAAGVLVFVLCIFLAWAWIRYSKARDEEVREQYGIEKPVPRTFPVPVIRSDGTTTTTSAPDSPEIAGHKKRRVTITSEHQEFYPLPSNGNNSRDQSQEMVTVPVQNHHQPPPGHYSQQTGFNPAANFHPQARRSASPNNNSKTGPIAKGAPLFRAPGSVDSANNSRSNSPNRQGVPSSSSGLNGPMTFAGRTGPTPSRRL